MARMGEQHWWNWRPQTYVQLVPMSALLLVVGITANYGFLRDWRRSLFAAIGYTTVWTLLEWWRIRHEVTRTADGDGTSESTDEDYRPPLFGNG